MDEHQLWEHINTTPTMNYLKTKGRESTQGETIYWEAMERAMKESSTLQKRACKFATGFFAHRKI